MAQNKVMRYTVRGAESKNAIIKVTQFINNLIQEAELGLKSLALYTIERLELLPHTCMGEAELTNQVHPSVCCLLSVICPLKKIESRDRDIKRSR